MIQPPKATTTLTPTAAELFLELFLFLSRLDWLERLEVPAAAAPIACLVGVSIFVIALLTSQPSPSAGPEYDDRILLPPLFRDNPFAWKVIVVCTLLLGFTTLPERDWESIFATSYVTLVLSVRFVQGVAWGGLFGKSIMPPVALLALASAGAIYYHAASPSDDYVRIAKTVWVLMAGLVASVSATIQISRRLSMDAASAAMASCGMFVMFASSSFFVVASESTRVAYSLLFAAGVVVGLLSTRWAALRRIRP